MATTMDPYYTWLGIPPAEQPPHHYRLLGVPLFETDFAVIGNAADRQTVYVKTFLSGPHTQAAERILAEIGTARMCLFDTQRRADYDARLRDRLPSAASSPAAADGDASAGQSYSRPAPREADESPAAGTAAALVAPPPRLATANPVSVAKKAPRKSAPAIPLLAVGAVAALVLMAGVVFALQSAFSGKKKEDVEVAKIDKKREPAGAVKPHERVTPISSARPEPTPLPPPEKIEFSQDPPDEGSPDGESDDEKRRDPRQEPIPFDPKAGFGLGSTPPTKSTLANSLGNSFEIGVTLQLLLDARKALQARDYEAARGLLAKAKAGQPSLEETAEIVQLEMLENYLTAFWQAVRKGIDAGTSGETFTFESTEYELVSHAGEVVTYKSGGKETQVQIADLDPRAAAAFAKRAAGPGEPLSLVHIGAFLAVDRKGDTATQEWQITHANQLWNDARDRGERNPVLAQELGIDLYKKSKRPNRPRKAPR